MCDYTVVSFYLYHSPSDDFYFGEIFQKPVFIFVYFSKNLMSYLYTDARPNFKEKLFLGLQPLEY